MYSLLVSINRDASDEPRYKKASNNIEKSKVFLCRRLLQD